MRSCLTSYHALFQRGEAGLPAVQHIEIPLIQRDFAQGREDAEAGRIRQSFLEALRGALTDEGPGICLDFVYGDVTAGTLKPLDGQQRLTTLFLLHWYLACRAGHPTVQADWTAFTYATRPGARSFCQRMAKNPFPADTAQIAAWIADQEWYLPTWQHDPTIQAMRVMIDAIHKHFEDLDAGPAWARLTDPAAPAITFHLLPIEKMGLASEELYIKMNSRGKKLTPFENFKALFEQMLEQSSPDRGKEFGRLVDGEWADVFWRLRGDDHAIDARFLRYFHFLTEICQWREGNVGEAFVDDLYPLAKKTFGPKNPRATEHLEFLFDALNIWIGHDSAAEFERWFASERTVMPEAGGEGKVLLFETSRDELNLFAQCCQAYGKVNSAGNRIFGWSSIHLLYAVVLRAIHEPADFLRQVRILRNLIEASADQLRQDSMPGLITDVEILVVDGTLEGVKSFNQAELEDERKKAALLEETPALQPALYHLEDHSLLRGRVFAFELDAVKFKQRAETFSRVFDPGINGRTLTAALLATGDYSRTRPSNRFFLFGPANRVERHWRALLAEGSRNALANSREVLSRFLDTVEASPLPERLETLSAEWLAAREAERNFDWRYYFVKYPAMREGSSGLYACQPRRLGYDVCMLNNQTMKGYFRDPYLLAIYQQAGLGSALHYPLFAGMESEARLLRLAKSGTGIRCVLGGFLIAAPDDEAYLKAFTTATAAYELNANGLLPIAQTDQEGQSVDTQDRIDIGASLVRDLVEAGL